MAKKLIDYTPQSQIRNALRLLFLRSRERAYAIKRDGYTCQICGKKQSKAKGKEVKVEVHHLEGICNWDSVISCIREQILCKPDKMQTLCEVCHKNQKEGV